MKLMSKSYTEGLIVFLDILGFSNYIEKTKGISEVEEIFDFVEKLCHLYNTSNISGIKITFFSDSFILTTEEISESSVTALFMACFLINLQLYQATKLFTRGAVCIGEYYHKDNIAFGPGIIQAYRDQESVAKYVRLIVSESVITRIDRQNPMIEKDSTGIYYCNYYYLDLMDASRFGVFDYEEAKQIIMKKREIIIEKLEEYRQTKVYEKYEWLVTPFNNCCKSLASEYKFEEFSRFIIQ